MKLKSKTIWQQYNAIILIISVVLLGALSVRLIVQKKLSDLEVRLQSQISEQQIRLVALAEITGRNSGDEISATIIHDCSVSERTAFDAHLSQLDKGLSAAELVVLERLFGRCGNFYAQQKSVMTARLIREIEVYQDYVAQMEDISNINSVEVYKLESWEALVEEEKKQAELFSKLVSSQDSIINTLLQGKSAQSKEIESILNDVKQTQESLITASKQAATIRTELTAH